LRCGRRAPYRAEHGFCASSLHAPNPSVFTTGPSSMHSLLQTQWSRRSMHWNGGATCCQIAARVSGGGRSSKGAGCVRHRFVVDAMAVKESGGGRIRVRAELAAKRGTCSAAYASSCSACAACAARSASAAAASFRPASSAACATQPYKA
jgi:hypothetical protein